MGPMRVPKRQREAHKSYLVTPIAYAEALSTSAMLQIWKAVVRVATAGMGR